MLDLFLEIFIPALSTFVLGLVGFAMQALKVKLSAYLDTKTKKEVVKTAVTAVEYIYTKLDIHDQSEEKLKLAVEKATLMLEDRGIKINTDELSTLIDSALNSLELEAKKLTDEITK